MQTNSTRKERIVRNAHAWNLTIGNAIAKDLSDRGWEIPTVTEDPDFHHFVHALNTSDWLVAAYFLQAGESQTLERATSATDTLCFRMAKRHLKPLYHAADRFRQDRNEWRGQLQEAYQFGKLPAYGPNIVQGELVDAPYASKKEVIKHGRNLTLLIPVFHEYEKINQLYQQPGTTETGANIRFTQGHNWSYGHFRRDLLNEAASPKGKRRVLVNWDAHRDLSTPFRHLSQELSILSKLMHVDKDRLLWLIQHAKSPEDIAEVTSMISIAGWILPLLYSQYFAREGISEIVLVVPREAMETSDKNYWPSYGTHTMGVGHTAIDHEEIDEIDQFLAQNQSSHTVANSDRTQNPDLPYPFREQLKKWQENHVLRSLQSVSPNPCLQTIRDELSEVVQNIQNIKVHIADPDNPDSIGRLIKDSDIYLSVDVDFAGTTHLGGWYNTSNPIPHYPLNQTPKEELRHLQLIERFKVFYQNNAENIKGVSVANSPDYTADETRRRPAAKIFEILTAGTSVTQPSWISGEANRIIPPQLQKHPSRHLLISLAGVLGISITGALFWHYLRSKEIRKDLEMTGT